MRKYIFTLNFKLMFDNSCLCKILKLLQDIGFTFCLAFHISSYFTLTVFLAVTAAAPAAVVATVSNQPEPISPLRERPPVFYPYSAPLTHNSEY